MTSTVVNIQATINAPVEKVWQYWTDTNHIVNWNSASPDWHSPSATHDLVPGGTFSYRMEAKDGSMGFDFGGTFDEVKKNELLSYTLGDGRKVTNKYIKDGNGTRVEVAFEAESENPVEMQRFGWQAILDNFKKYVENN